jgi:hypothetical protein
MLAVGEADANEKPVAIEALVPGQVGQAKLVATGKFDFNWRLRERKKKPARFVDGFRCETWRARADINIQM